MTLKTKNMLLTMGVVSVLLLTVVGVTYQSTMVVIQKTIADHQLALVADRVKATEIWLDQQMRILNATANSIPFGNLGLNRETLAPLEMAMKAGHFSDVYIGLTDGVLIDGAGWAPPEDYDPRIRPWYRRAESAGKTSFTTPYLDLVVMKLVIALVTPLRHEGVFYGVMGADTVLDSLVDTLLSTKVSETGYLFVVNANGTILIHPKRDYVMKAKLQDIEPALWNITERFQKASSGTIRYQHQGEEHLLAYKQISNTDWFLCTSLPMTEAYAQSQKTTLLFATEIVLKVLGGLALLTLFGVGGSAAVLYVSSRRFETTIQRQEEEISGISEDLRWNINKRHEVETRYQTLFNVANDAILVSHGLTCIECNEKASELFGGARHNLIGRDLTELFPAYQPDGSRSQVKAKRILDQAKTGGQQYYEWTFRRLDGSEFPAEVGLKILQLDAEELILTSIRDISKRVFAERQLLQTQKMAAMGEMLGAIAHQWRQPLNTLSTYIASLQSAFYNRRIDKQFVDTLVNNADTQVQFMSKTIDDFRHFFKPSKSKQPFDIVEAVQRAVKLMEPQLRQGEIRLKIHNSSETQALIVHGFQSEFVHVIVNILANAKDAIEELAGRGGKQGERLISIDIDSPDGEILLQVRDNGCGIPEHLLSKIFAPYFTTKGTVSGTGIGLYMAKMIVENEMKGTLTAGNTGSGALFTIRLPRMAEEGIVNA